MSGEPSAAGRRTPRDKRWVYDGGIHEPMIIRWPDGRDAGATVERLISFIDLPATVLSLAGVRIPEPAWKLYVEPLRINSNTRLRARAVRYGYAESPETSTTIRIESGG